MSYLVLNDLRSRLSKSFEHWLLERSKSDRKVPSIYIGQLPPRKGSGSPNQAKREEESSSDMPFILIRSIDGNLTENERVANYQLNVAIIVGIYSKESLDEYEKGVQIVMNALDHLILSINQFKFWGNRRFSLESDMKWSYGLGKTIDPYECGLQTDAPYFATVLHIAFNRNLHLPKVEIEHLI